MKQPLALIATGIGCGLLLLTGSVQANGNAHGRLKTEVVACSLAHNIRLNGTEIRTSVINFTNLDQRNSATITRLTIQDSFGQIIHDSGPATGTPHPLNPDYNPPIDITTVPPGGSYYIATNQIWGLNPVPGSPSGTGGQAMTATIEYAKHGDSDLLLVHGRARTRQRIALPNGSFQHGGETSANEIRCIEPSRQR